ncbi:MAG: hypothetical protein WBE13_08620, partial [Candidatus Acidiferrum sp.]
AVEHARHTEEKPSESEFAGLFAFQPGETAEQKSFPGSPATMVFGEVSGHDVSCRYKNWRWHAKSKSGRRQRRSWCSA